LAAVRLASTLHVSGVAAELRRIATLDSSADLKEAAIAGLAMMGGDRNHDVLTKLASNGPVGTIRMQAIAAVTAFNLPLAAREAAGVFARLTADDDPGSLLAAFLDRKEGPDALARGLTQEKMPADVAKRLLRAMYGIGRSDAALSDVLSQAA